MLRSFSNSDFWADAGEQLAQMEQADLRRSIHPSASAAGPSVIRDGRRLLNFSSNNYLDLAAHPRVVARACREVQEWGAGSGGSRLITGALDLHDALETRISRFKGTEAALLFSSGYLANMGLVQAFGTRADGSSVPVFFDRLAHASIVDSAFVSRVHWRTFAHNDPEGLRRLLARLPAGGRFPRAVVVTEGVFSMDGDVAPLPEYVSLAGHYGALLVVDDAHGVGTIGPEGRGTPAFFGVNDCPFLVQMGTLSKSLGSLGGYVACSSLVRELLLNKARAFIFDTALSPACAAAADEALAIIEEEPWRVAHLQENAARVRRMLGITPPPAQTAVIPFIVGEAARALSLSAHLRERGFLVVAIRPPTVPRASSRLRISVMCSHTEEQILGLAQALESAPESHQEP